jgi:hypothetical protein
MGKIGRGSQMGAWHQGRTGWLTVGRNITLTWVSQWGGELLCTGAVQSLWQAGSWGQGQFGNPEEGEYSLLENGIRRLTCVH